MKVINPLLIVPFKRKRVYVQNVFKDLITGYFLHIFQ